MQLAKIEFKCIPLRLESLLTCLGESKNLLNFIEFSKYKTAESFFLHKTKFCSLNYTFFKLMIAHQQYRCIMHFSMFFLNEKFNFWLEISNIIFFCRSLDLEFRLDHSKSSEKITSDNWITKKICFFVFLLWVAEFKYNRKSAIKWFKKWIQDGVQSDDDEILRRAFANTTSN